MQVLLLITLLAMSGNVETDGLMVASHVVCFTLYAVSTAILVIRCRSRRATFGIRYESKL